MNILEWVADHALIVAAGTAVVAIASRFKEKLSPKIKRYLLVTEIVVIVSTLMLAALKHNLDSKWKLKLTVADSAHIGKEQELQAELLNFRDFYSVSQLDLMGRPAQGTKN